VVGDFNSHLDRRGYAKTDKHGAEVEDWQIDVNLQLLNRANDIATCYSKAWKSNSTPELAFSTVALAHKIERQVLDQVGGSDHRPIKLVIDLNLNTPYHKPIPRWNYKRADWSKFVAVSEAKCKAINFQGKRLGKRPKHSIEPYCAQRKNRFRGMPERIINPTGPKSFKTWRSKSQRHG
jgi:hypothetical protein